MLIMARVWAENPTAPATIEGATTLTAEQVITLILNEPALALIDTRRVEEYVKGHIEGSINLPDTDMSPELLASHVEDKNTPVLFYCNGARCLRSSNALLKAKEWGYQQLYWFRGGWLEWREKRLPIAR